MADFLAEEVEDIHESFLVSDDAVLNPEQIANMLGMNAESVRRWCRQNKITHYSFGGKFIIMGKDFKTFIRASRRRAGLKKFYE
ncbi:helix-turn-helix domain-containing protein [Neobacillus sp. SuZ13]|uniref:helix-turn-helix domain-containing protein n=1 Tax=Neobacillus sp. SuZ13 TaxID=3047875 RepID=UPI0024C04574|nr:helix-turn-helix domain-containing protein [Neobacillus sp. SuZ13]WHY65379.1 helix-turn-helix domain-containing protein [Neobacillus sp. SuZ13]